MKDKPTINFTRKERASAAYQRSAPRSKQEIDAFERGYAAAEWDFDQARLQRKCPSI